MAFILLTQWGGVSTTVTKVNHDIDYITEGGTDIALDEGKLIFAAYCQDGNVSSNHITSEKSIKAGPAVDASKFSAPGISVAIGCTGCSNAVLQIGIELLSPDAAREKSFWAGPLSTNTASSDAASSLSAPCSRQLTVSTVCLAKSRSQPESSRIESLYRNCTLCPNNIMRLIFMPAY